MQETEFEYIDNVPVFHQNTYEDGDNSFEFNEHKLNEIVDINNKRIAVGENPVIIVGHTDGTDNEKPVIGFIDKFTMGVRNGLNTIFATFKIYSDKIDLLKSFPKRSIEISSDNIIPACAILGGNEPRLDLGLLYKEANQVLKFSKGSYFATTINKFKEPNKEDNKMDNDNKPVVSEDEKAKILAVLQETDCFKFLEELMAEKNKEAEVKDEDVLDEEVKEEVKDEEDDVKEDDEKFSKLNAEYELLKLSFRKSEREKALIKMQNEGYVFNINEELEDSEDMDDMHFGKHLTRIQRFSKRAPIGKSYDIAKVQAGGKVGGQPTSEELEEIKRFALTNKLSFKDAVLQFSKRGN